MKTSVAFALAAAKLVAGHTTFQSFIVGGKDQGQHFAVQTPSNGNNPILDVTSTAMNCNGGKATSDFVSVAAGSELTFQWHHNDPATTSGDADEPIAASHKGPVMVYVAKADTQGQGAVWTKIFEDGLGSDGKWAVDKFISNKGKISITLPNLADGEYLIRPEILALHEGNREKGAQFYNGCGQIKVTGGSVQLPSTGTDMTKAYSATDPGVLVNIYNNLQSYKIPGPAVWNGASSGGAAPATPTKPVSSPAASAAPSKTASPVASSAPSKSASPVSSAAPVATQPSKPTATSAPAPGNGNGSTLPETFTINQFIAWLKQQAGSSAKARRHAREFSL